MKALFVVVALATAIHCKQSLPEEPPFVVFPPYDDAGFDAEVSVNSECSRACANLVILGCPESWPAGRSCGSTCEVASAHGFDMRPRCLAEADSANAVRACCSGVRCAKVNCRGR